jgi:hypothetical protein
MSERASSAGKGISHLIQVVQSSESLNQQQLLESARRKATIRGSQNPRQQVEIHFQIVRRQVYITVRKD